MKRRTKNRILTALVTVLAVLFLAGAGLLFFWNPDDDTPQEFPAVTGTAAQTTLQTAVQTTVTAAAVTTAPPAETAAPAETTAPPEDDDPYAVFVQDVLIPKYGRAAEGPAEQDAQTGIAAAYRSDFLGRGAEDLLVVRLDLLDGVRAPVPVLLLYTTFEGQIVLADTFESKLPWSGYRIRCAERTVYISGDAADPSVSPENWKRSELTVQIQDNRDMILLNMEEGSGENAPAADYPADAELLLEMQPDDTNPDARRYMLYQYTALPS